MDLKIRYSMGRHGATKTKTFPTLMASRTSHHWRENTSALGLSVSWSSFERVSYCHFWLHIDLRPQSKSNLAIFLCLPQRLSRHLQHGLWCRKSRSRTSRPGRWHGHFTQSHWSQRSRAGKACRQVRQVSLGKVDGGILDGQTGSLGARSAGWTEAR